MVDDDVVLVRAAVEDALGVAAPRAGVDRDGERSHVGDVVHDGGVVVARQNLVPAALGGRKGRGRDAVKGLSSRAWN